MRPLRLLDAYRDRKGAQAFYGYEGDGHPMTIREAIARRIREEMGPVFGTPEYLARPGNVERLEARQQSAAEKWADAALSAIEAAGWAAVPVEATDLMANMAHVHHEDYGGEGELKPRELWSAMLSAAKDAP